MDLIFFFFLDELCVMQDPSCQGWNPGSLQWKGRISSTGPLGKSLIFFFFFFNKPCIIFAVKKI